MPMTMATKKKAMIVLYMLLTQSVPPPRLLCVARKGGGPHRADMLTEDTQNPRDPCPHTGIRLK